jgi:hypothetical protein
MGCGPGNYSKYIFSKGFKNITGYDLSEEMIKRAKKNVPEGNFKLEDIRKVQLPPASCHGVFASFSIPYLSYHETDHFIEFSSKVLKHSGVLYISCIEGTHCGFEQMSFSGEMAVFIYHYTEDFLTTAMEEKGFQINRYDFTQCENEEKRIEEEAQIIQASLDIEQSPLCRVGHFATKSCDYLLIVIHHLVTDGVSWRILLEDFAAAYMAFGKSDMPSLPAEVTTFKAYSEAIREYSRDAGFEKNLEYFKSVQVEQLETIQKNLKNFSLPFVSESTLEFKRKSLEAIEVILKELKE